MKYWKQLSACGVAIAVLVASCFIMQNKNQGSNEVALDSTASSEYSAKLFDNSYVHTINIDLSDEDLADLLASPTQETFYSCNLTIDGETYNNVGIRTKGNSSLTQVADSDSDRYSFKVNFGKYDKQQSYYGLDKFVMNNLVQDATMMKDYLSYTLMSEFGVASPEVSYSYITINGEEWGLYLNAECLDESFLERNYGEDYGNLYKPSTDDMMGGGMKGGRPGEEGKEFDPAQMPEMKDQNGEADNQPPAPNENGNAQNKDGVNPEGNMPNAAGAAQQPTESSLNMESAEEKVVEIAEEQEKMGMGEPPAFGKDKDNGASLKYVDDAYESYSAIFDNAETKVTDADKDTLIASLKQISEGTNLDEVLDTDALLRYFVVHNFVDNYDSYTGNMLHNYYLYEKDGKLTMLPWDYNLAFGAFGGGPGGGQDGNRPGMQREGNVNAAAGQPAATGNETAAAGQPAATGKGNAAADQSAATGNENAAAGQPAATRNENAAEDQLAPAENGNAVAGQPAPTDNGKAPGKQGSSNNASSMVNMAIDTPLSGAEEADRPVWSQLINNETYKEQYHNLFDEFVSEYIESGKIETEIDRVTEMIRPYVEKDPKAFYTYDEFETAVSTLKTFISLRGQSIRAQLEGTIPSTTEEQNSFTGELVDASSINLSDMGSNDMGHGKEGKMQQHKEAANGAAAPNK